MYSLRGRHLLNVIAIIIIGLFVLGVVLSSSIYQHKAAAVSEELERTALDLLVYLEYDAGRFTIAESNKAAAETFLNERKLRTGGKERFAYLWDVTQQKITWDSVDSNAVDQQAVQDNFALFDVDALLQTLTVTGQGLIPASTRVLKALPQTAGQAAVPYWVAVQKFTAQVGNEQQHYLLLVATTAAAVDEAVYALLPTPLLMLLSAAVLLLLAQIFFSRWVMTPLRTFEQEVQAIARGEQATFERHYPAELQAIQQAIAVLKTPPDTAIK